MTFPLLYFGTAVTLQYIVPLTLDHEIAMTQKMFFHNYWKKCKKRSEQYWESSEYIKRVSSNKMNVGTALGCRVITVADKRCVHRSRWEKAGDRKQKQGETAEVGCNWVSSSIRINPTTSWVPDPGMGWPELGSGDGWAGHKYWFFFPKL